MPTAREHAEQDSATGTTRRRAFLAGTVSGSVGLAGCQTGERRSIGVDTDEEDTTGQTAGPTGHAHDGGRLGEEERVESIATAAIDAHDVRVGRPDATPDESTFLGINARQLVSNEPRELYVDPQEGDDANDGTEANPVQNVNEAISRVPKFVYHPHKIYLAYGDYTYPDQESVRLWHHTLYPVSHEGRALEIFGHDERNPMYDDSKSPEDLRFTYGISCGNRGHVSMLISGITVDGRWQAYDDIARFRNCIFEGGQGPKGRAFGGYKNRILFEDCTFRNCGEGLKASVQSFVELSRCEGENITSEEGTGRPYRAVHGSWVALRDSDDFESAGDTPSQVDESSIVTGGPNGINRRLADLERRVEELS
jgi:hypothetical protein